ncbi:MAG: hypothetical protein ABIG11_03335 [bacterium]
MKKIILAVTVMAATASISFADMSGLENAAADAAIAARTGSLESASGIADMAFSGGLAVDDKGAVFVNSDSREAVKKELPSRMAEKQALMSKVPGIQNSAKSEKSNNDPGFVGALWLGLKAPVTIAKYGAIFGIQMVSPGSNSDNGIEHALAQIGAGILGGVLGLAVGLGIMAISPFLAVGQLFKGNLF